MEYMKYLYKYFFHYKYVASAVIYFECGWRIPKTYVSDPAVRTQYVLLCQPVSTFRDRYMLLFIYLIFTTAPHCHIYPPHLHDSIL